MNWVQSGEAVDISWLVESSAASCQFQIKNPLSIMGEIPHNSWIRLVISLTLVTVVQGHFVQYNYKKVANGQSFNGTLEEKYTGRSKIECSLRYETV